MKLYKTLYLGCDDNCDIATIENNVVRINDRFNAAHRPIMGVLCYYFFHAQVLQQENLLDKPYKLSIIFKQNRLNDKISERNKSTIKDTLYFFLNNMLPPEKGIIVSIYTTDIMENKVAPYEDFRCITPFKDEWQWVGDGDYITLQDIEPDCDVRELYESHENLKIIKDIDNISIYPVKRITYAMSENEMFSLLKHSKFHLAYPGGTYYSAAMMNCPTIGLYRDTYIPDSSYQGNIIGYLIYDYKTKRAIKKKGKLDYIKHVTNDELKCYLKGYIDYK